MEVQVATEAPWPPRYYRLASIGLTLADWMEARGLSDPDEDSFGYGWSNLMTFATGADLMVDPREARPRLEISEIKVDGRTDPYAVFTYQVREGMEGVTPLVQSSPDLWEWMDALPELVPAASSLSADGVWTVSLREPASMSSSSYLRRFYRLRMEAGVAGPVN